MLKGNNDIGGQVKDVQFTWVLYSYLILGVYLIAEQHESRPVNIFTGKDERTFLFFSAETIWRYRDYSIILVNDITAHNFGMFAFYAIFRTI